MPSKETYIEIIKSKDELIKKYESENNFLRHLTLQFSKQLSEISKQLSENSKNNTIVNNHLEANTMAKNEFKSDRSIKTNSYYEQSGNLGIGHSSNGKFKNTKISGVLNEAKQRNLAEAAAEIHELLEQLSKTYTE